MRTRVALVGLLAPTAAWSEARSPGHHLPHLNRSESPCQPASTVRSRSNDPDAFSSGFCYVYRRVTKRRSKGAYMISAVAEMYGIHPQTLRLYEREGLLKPSRTEGNTRLYTDEDLQRLEFILNLARDLGVNISGIAIILQMRERMEEMQRQIQDFVKYLQEEVMSRASAANDPSRGAIVPIRRPFPPARNR